MKKRGVGKRPNEHPETWKIPGSHAKTPLQSKHSSAGTERLEGKPEASG